MQKILYFGGQKSGKTSLAQKKALELSGTKKPYYIATYLDEFEDIEMGNRIENHLKDRGDEFITIEQGHDFISVIKEEGTYIIDCISMWLLNCIQKSEEELMAHIKKVCQSEANIIFVLNDVSCGVIPMDKISRKYVDLTGIIGQALSKECDEVYEVKFGIGVKIK